MGCTLISVVSPLVLILAYFVANIKVTVDTSNVQNEEEHQTISTMSTANAFTSEANPRVRVADYTETNHTDKNIFDDSNTTMLEKYNCTSNKIDKKNCSAEVPSSSSVISRGNVAKGILTFRDFKEFEHYKIVIDMLPYVPNIPGIITNSLTLIIAANIKPLHTSEMYMIALGCSDFITVVTRCAYYVWSTYNHEQTAVSCKVPRYIKHVALIFSNMTLMAWTVERLIAVIFPIKLATWCSIRTIKILLILLLLLCLLLAIPYVTETDPFIVANGIEIVTTCIEKDFMGKVWTHVESFYYIYIPMVCVSACNIAILCRLSYITKSRMNMTINKETIDKKASENRRMTILLLTISGCFLVLHIPYSIILVFNYIYSDILSYITDDPEFFAKYLLYTTIGFFIIDFQNSVNFFLYCISGNKFRATFMRIFCKIILKRKRTVTEQTTATRTTAF